MPDIVLATLNAKHLHAALGLRCLQANLGPLRNRSRLLEFDINQRPVDIAERILELRPRIVGLGVYVWNATASTELAGLLKRIEPSVRLVLGGPEVSHETEAQAMVNLADWVIAGEADLAFAQLCAQVLEDRPPADKIIAAAPPDPASLAPPYELYTAEDLARRLTYVEASRGCPFGCEFCLSALDAGVRQFPLDRFLEELEKLLARGARHFKFVDRTFNLREEVCQRVLEFLLARLRPGLFFHFEIVPDLLPGALREAARRFPPGALQFEAGVQTFNPEVAERIGRRQDGDRVEANLRWLRQETAAHLHTDLIVGLPGESLASFGAGFDRLLALRPHEIQVGILKRLRGAPIARHDHAFRMVYSPHPPYEILRNDRLDFATVQRLRRFARYWDLVGNSGNFIETTPLLWSGEGAGSASPFESFLRFSDWLFGEVRRTDAIALPRLLELVFRYLTEVLGRKPDAAAETLWRDYQRAGRSDRPAFLAAFVGKGRTAKPAHQPGGPRRQARHHAAAQD